MDVAGGRLAGIRLTLSATCTTVALDPKLASARILLRMRSAAETPPMAQRAVARSVAGTYGFDVAEQKQSEVLLMAKVEEHPLRVEVERV